jgi:glutamate-1-semialdehyde 2,1-aminomutase
MSAVAPPTLSPRIDAAYRERFAGSAALYERATRLMPSGINHDVRRIDPFPVYIDRASGAWKWDVDDNRIIDYCVGHGALILGHGHPAVLAAMQAQLARVTHASAPTPHEVHWAELVTSMVPSAERVRFVLSGTEATMLAIRLVRAATGRDVIVRVDGHFHGWHDAAMVRWLPPYERPSSAGVGAGIAAGLRSIPLHDLGALEEALAPGDVAGMILEPDGPVVGSVPVPRGYLRAVREITARHGVPLIFDEVVTGFRLAPGGAQEWFGVVPDVTTFAKAIAGGSPSGAVAGRADILDGIAFTDDPARDRRERVAHMGTYSAHPMAAAAGVAALELLADGSVQDRTAGLADDLRAGLNNQIARRGVRGTAYGLRSCFRVVVGDDDELPDASDADTFVARTSPARLIEGIRRPLRGALHKAFFLEGFDLIAGNHGWLSSAHRDADIEATVAGFGRALDRVMEEGLLRPRREAAGPMASP